MNKSRQKGTADNSLSNSCKNLYKRIHKWFLIHRSPCNIIWNMFVVKSKIHFKVTLLDWRWVQQLVGLRAVESHVAWHIRKLNEMVGTILVLSFSLYVRSKCRLGIAGSPPSFSDFLTFAFSFGVPREIFKSWIRVLYNPKRCSRLRVALCF